MRKPPARKFALTLIILHFLASFIPYTEDDAPFFINMWNFFKKVFVDSRTFINMGAGRPADAFSFDDVLLIPAAIILIIFLVTKSGRRFLKQYFDPNEAGEKYYEQDKSYRGKIKVEGLDGFELFLYDLAEKAGIHEVVFRYNPNATIHSIEQSGYVSVIELGDEFLNRLSRIRNTAVRNQFLSFAVSHELIHIKYHDPMNIIWLNVASVVLWLDGFLLIGLVPLLLSEHPSLMSVAIRFACIVFWICYASVVARSSYWSHCAEYRADREALILSGANVDVVFTAFSRCFPEMRESYKIGVGDVVKNLWNALIGRGEILDSYAHPSLSQRRQEAQRKQETNNGEWGIFDYFRVAVLMIIAQIKGERQHEN